VNTDITTARGALRELERDLLRTATLAILHNRAASLARSSLLARSTIRHRVMELDVRVLGHGNLVLVDGEVLAGAAVERWPLADRHGALDALALEAALGQGITLAEAVGAGPATEVEAAIGGEAAGAKIPPAPAGLLLSVALVVVIIWCLER
jgi:hypothetical protein